MAKFKYKNPKEQRKNVGIKGINGKVATHHCMIADLVNNFEKPTILELGTCEGTSTSLLLTECEKNNGFMVSVDIEDRSDVAISNNWQFIKSDDLLVDYIITQAEILKNGIDILHIDSLHTYEHVSKQLMNWYEYVNEGGYITLHDVDPYACSPDGFKPSASTYQDLAGDLKAVKEFFYANQDNLFLEIHYGATGMAIIKKLSARGEKPFPAKIIRGYKRQPGIIKSSKLLISSVKRLFIDRISTLIGNTKWENRYDEVEW